MSSQLQKQKIKVLSETLTTRCDTCHQTDQYDAINQICLRCKDVKNNLLNQENSFTQHQSLSKSTNNNKEGNFLTVKDNSQKTVSLRELIISNELNKRLLIGVLSLSVVIGLIVGFLFPTIYYVTKYGFDTNYKSDKPVYAEHLELSLTNPENNPPIILSLNNVTILEFDEEVLNIISPSNGLAELTQSSYSNKVYLIGKNPKPLSRLSELPSTSGSLIIETKTSTFHLYFNLTEDSYQGAFNSLVTVKKQTLNNTSSEQE